MSAGTIRRRNRVRNSERAQERIAAAAAKRQEFLDNSVMTRRGRRRITGSNSPSKTSSSDGAVLSSEAKSLPKANPYEGLSSKTSSVEVAPGDNLSSLLSKMGYSGNELYGKNGVLERVAKTNGLKNPNLIRPGQKLVLPTKDQAAAKSAEPAQASSTVTETQANGSNERSFMDGLKEFFNFGSVDSSQNTNGSTGSTRRSRRIAMHEAALVRKEEAAAARQEFLDNSVMTRRGRRRIRG